MTLVTRTPSLPAAPPVALTAPGRARLLRGALAIAITVVASLVLGGLTSPAQQYLPIQVHSFANSIGGWTMLAFLVVRSVRVRPVLGAVLGIVAFLALNEGYGIVSAWRGFFYADPFSGVWTLAGLAAGPVIGAAAAVSRHGRPDARVVATAVLSAVLVAESTFMLARGIGLSPVYWVVQLVLGAAFLVAAIVLAAPRWRAVVIALVGIAAATATFPAATLLLS